MTIMMASIITHYNQQYYSSQSLNSTVSSIVSLRLNTDVATVYTDLDERVTAALSAIDFAERQDKP